MANVLIESQTMTEIANAIREKNGTDATYKPAEMPNAVREIESIESGNPYQILQDKFFYFGRTSFIYTFANSKITYDDLSNLVLDTSNGTDFNAMFYNCTNLTTIPQLDTSKGTSFLQMFRSCGNLTTIPQLDTSQGTNFLQMFFSCINLTTIPQLDTSKGTNFSQMFYSCGNLTTIPQLDISNGTNINSMFGSCYALKNISFVANCIKKSISFASSPLLNDESRQSIFDGLADLTGQGSQVLTLNKTLEEKITDEQKAYVVSKNWQLAFI